MNRFLLIIVLFTALFLGGCSCMVDHQQQAATAQQRITALERFDPSHPNAVPESDLTPSNFRLLAAKELKTWKVVKARAQEADELPEDAR